MSSNNKKLIAVIGATGQQGGGVLRALQARGQFQVRALTRNPDKHRELAEEVVEAGVQRRRAGADPRLAVVADRAGAGVVAGRAVGQGEVG